MLYSYAWLLKLSCQLAQGDLSTMHYKPTRMSQSIGKQNCLHNKIYLEDCPYLIVVLLQEVCCRERPSECTRLFDTDREEKVFTIATHEQVP
mmetsp:Transcript_13/g.116  ORF Transcript_13/g.116 Transcript_13/m.116 type:complete len:92 (-) Transcript_13:5809-6084(-)